MLQVKIIIIVTYSDVFFREVIGTVSPVLKLEVKIVFYSDLDTSSPPTFSPLHQWM